MLGCLCPQRQGRATINAETPTLCFLTFTELSGDGGLYCTCTDRHTQTDTGTCWRDWVCLLRVFAETKDKKKIRGMTIWLPTLEDNVQLSGLLFGSCHSPTTWTFHLLHLNIRIRTRSLVQTRLLPHRSTRCARSCHARSESLFSLLPLQKPESLWRTFSFTLAETFEVEKNLSNNCYRKTKT